jgi:hypothetical protein
MSNGLAYVFCSGCNKLLAIIPSEFTDTFRTPCKKCQGWEVKHNFDLYLLKYDQERYKEYKKISKELFRILK